MPLALPTPDLEPSDTRLVRHLATFRSVQAAASEPEPHPGEDEADRTNGHPKLVLRQLSRVFGERR
ncbi:MAG: hypothetical protein J7549_16195 [Variovorax sp.]|nr:hypothetical protein [Variovorax sp.]